MPALLYIDNPTAIIDDTEQRTFDISTKIINDVSFVPLRFIAEKIFAATVEYKDEENAVYITIDEINIFNGIAYLSADEAAIAFVENFCRESFYVRHEYGAFIYSKTYDENTLYYLADVSFPEYGEPHEIKRFYTSGVPAGAEYVGFVHTHPDINTGFSPRDIVASEIYAYVVIKNLTLYRYNVSNRKTQKIKKFKLSELHTLTDTQCKDLESKFRESWEKHLENPTLDCLCHNCKSDFPKVKYK
jgi:proteasome lid subunit RPN8/RPN11